MPSIEIPEDLWNQINTLSGQFGFHNTAEFLRYSLEATQTRYCPAVSAIVTWEGREVLMVGNDYGEDDLVWNLPGGAVDPGEDLVQAVKRELHEETGLNALEVGPLSWVVQINGQNNKPFIIVFAFTITAWEGEISLDNEVDHGDVQQAQFMPYAKALDCMIYGNQVAFRDWLAEPQNVPRLYFAASGIVREITPKKADAI
jgi:ADP-ribose pyrophosphatase YjhB (NUDIX family)